jgi:hypothetical protein
MIQVTGTHNTAICYTGELESAAFEQIKAVCDRAEFADCKIRIMPDVHAGEGQPKGPYLNTWHCSYQDPIVRAIKCGSRYSFICDAEITNCPLESI